MKDLKPADQIPYTPSEPLGDLDVYAIISESPELFEDLFLS
jgi:hypothetical protein